MSGDAEDLEEDFDGLFPVVLSARFEREVAVNEWFGQLTVIWLEDQVEMTILLLYFCLLLRRTVFRFDRRLVKIAVQP